MTPKEWKRCKIGDFINIKHGYAFKGDFISTEDNGIVLVPPGNFAISGGFQENKCKYYTGVYPNDYILKPDDIIVTMTDLSKDSDTLGYSAKVPHISKKIYLHNQRIGLVEFKNNYINKDFLYWFMRTMSYQKTIVSSSSGSVIKHTSPSRICDVDIELPPLETQQKIAKVLSAIDDKIELNNSINSNLEQQAQAIFKSWFVDFEPFGGKMPNDWSLKTLSDVSNITAGGDKPDIVSNIETEECKIPIYSNGVDQNGLYGYTTLPKISQESVTVSARGTIGFTCLRLHSYVPIVRLISLIPINDIVSAKYLYFALLNKHITGTGTTQQQLTVPYFKTTEIIVPSFDIICNFTKITDLFYKIIEKNNMENSSLSQLRDTILPKLMSGEIDVDKVEV